MHQKCRKETRSGFQNKGFCFFLTSRVVSGHASSSACILDGGSSSSSAFSACSRPLLAFSFSRAAQDACCRARRSRAFSTPQGKRERPRLSALQTSFASNEAKIQNRFSTATARRNTNNPRCRKESHVYVLCPRNGGQITPKAREGCSGDSSPPGPQLEKDRQGRVTLEIDPRVHAKASCIDCQSPRLFNTRGLSSHIWLTRGLLSKQRWLASRMLS